MDKGDARMLDAGGRELRVSSGDRVIFPATERTPEVSKLEVVEYFLAVEDGIMRALRNRPTTLERWPKGVHEGMTLSTREGHKGDAFYQKRVPKGPRTTWKRHGSSSRRAATPTRSARPGSRWSAGARRWAR